MRMFTIKPGNDTDEFYAAIEDMIQGPLPKGKYRPEWRSVRNPYTILRWWIGR